MAGCRGVGWLPKHLDKMTGTAASPYVKALDDIFLGYAYGWMVQASEEQIRQQVLSDVHAPAKWRVIGPLANVQEFYEAFGVGPIDAMWRPVMDRAIIW